MAGGRRRIGFRGGKEEFLREEERFWREEETFLRGGEVLEGGGGDVFGGEVFAKKKKRINKPIGA